MLCLKLGNYSGMNANGEVVMWENDIIVNGGKAHASVMESVCNTIPLQGHGKSLSIPLSLRGIGRQIP